MSRISIDIDQVQQANEGLAGSLLNIQEARSMINSMKYSLSENVLNRRGISGQISSILSNLDTLSSRINLILSTTTSAYTQYSDTEDYLYREGIKKLGFEEKSANAALFYDIANDFKLSQDLFDSRTLSQAELNLLALYYSKFEKDQGKISESTSVLAYIHNDLMFGFGNYATTLEADKYEEAASIFQLVGSDFALSTLGYDFTAKNRKVELTAYGLKYVDEYGKEGYILKSTLEGKSDLTADIKMDKVTDKISDRLKDKGYSEEADLYQYANNGLDYDQAKKSFSKNLGSLYEQSIAVSGAVSLFEGSVSGKSDYGNYSADIKLGNAQANASLTSGLYAVDKNGKRSLSPGVKAKVGVGVSALEAKAEGQLGNDMAGLYGEANVSALSAEATAQAGLGMVDGELEVKASASAEAILAEVGVEGGVNVLGGKVGGSASVNVGIGAKADVGYSDGVIKCNVAASLGVGVDLSVEVDVGGMVDTVAGAASSAMNDISDFVDWLF